MFVDNIFLKGYKPLVDVSAFRKTFTLYLNDNKKLELIRFSYCK